MTDSEKKVLDVAHSTEVKKVGIIAVAALQDVFDTYADKFPLGAAPFLKGLGDDLFSALGERLQHLLQNQEAKEVSVSQVTTLAPEAAAVAKQ